MSDVSHYLDRKKVERVSASASTPQPQMDDMVRYDDYEEPAEQVTLYFSGLADNFPLSPGDEITVSMG